MATADIFFEVPTMDNRLPAYIFWTLQAAAHSVSSLKLHRKNKNFMEGQVLLYGIDNIPSPGLETAHVMLYV